MHDGPRGKSMNRELPENAGMREPKKETHGGADSSEKGTAGR
jgi:hypothetical protein